MAWLGDDHREGPLLFFRPKQDGGGARWVKKENIAARRCMMQVGKNVLHYIKYDMFCVGDMGGMNGNKVDYDVF
jgi:hypothetical protein